MYSSTITFKIIHSQFKYMHIQEMNSEFREKLRKSGLFKEMKSLESCDFFAIEEEGSLVVGVAGLGGLFHVSAIQITEKWRGKGLGKKLQGELISEAKKRNYSFLTVYNDPRNIASEKMHNSLGYKTIFRIHYSRDIVNNVKILVFTKRAILVKQFLKIFNSKIGMLILGILLKFTRKIYPKIILYNEENIPKPSIINMIKKFEKI